MFNQLGTMNEQVVESIIDMNSEIAENSNNNNEGKEITLESRFGEVTVDVERAIFFPQGICGIPEKMHFAIIDMPSKNLGDFKLLQCLNDPSLSFVVFPLSLENDLIEKQDLVDCCEVTKINSDGLLTLLIASIQRAPKEDGTIDIGVTLNVRAPIIVDTKDQSAMQYVFSSNKYAIRHEL